MENVYFIEYNDGRVEKVEGALNPAELGLDVKSAFTVATVFTKQSVFKSVDMTARPERRVKMPDGTMKLRSEMTPEEAEWYSKVRKEAAVRAAASRKANAANKAA